MQVAAVNAQHCDSNSRGVQSKDWLFCFYKTICAFRLKSIHQNMVNKTSRVLGLIVLILGLITFSMRIHAQNVVRKGSTFVEQADSTKQNGVKTKYTYMDKNGVEYPIYLSSKDKAYIICISKKTGKKYKRYLPNVTAQLSTKQN